MSRFATRWQLLAALAITACLGNENYESCTADVTLYANCTNFAGQPSNLRSFGGTSESAPLTAGVAALVIQAYRHTTAEPTLSMT